jgi:hypothetical protein
MKTIKLNSTFFKCICLLILGMSLSYVCFSQAGGVYTLAGGGSATGNGVPATSANLIRSAGIGMDASDNFYYSDNRRYIVRKVNGGTGLVTTVAGSYNLIGNTGDGGPATAARFINLMEGIFVNPNGDIYICDYSRVRKVDASTGIINTVAGGGSSDVDYVPATTAMLGTYTIHVDREDNIYFGLTGKIRKVDQRTGLISTIAGNGYAGSTTGDGEAAWRAGLYGKPRSICMDDSNNVYFIEGSFDRIRKIRKANGIITTVAGGGSSNADCIPATNASFSNLTGCTVDGKGNIFIADRDRGLIRRVDAATGKVCTIAGNEGGGSSDEGTPALSARINPYTIYLNPSTGKIYFSEYDTKVKMLSFSPIIPFSSADRDSFYTRVLTRPRGPQLHIRTKSYRPGMRVRTDFGDGSFDTSTINSSWSSGRGFALVNHDYSTNRTFNITQVLDTSGIPYDTIYFDYNQVFCSDMSASFYNDLDFNCIKSASEPYLMQQVEIQVDSNRVHVDTLVATSGFHYNAHGNPGDIYSFKVLSAPSYIPFCPSSGIIYDTLHAGITTNTPKSIGFACSTGVRNVDLEAQAFMRSTTPNEQTGHLYLRNNNCPITNSTVTLQFSPKYEFLGRANPLPISSTSSSITWDLASLSSIAGAPKDLYYLLSHNASYAYPRDGDTVNSSVTITPASGLPDVNMANNVVVRVDTVRTSCDPNAMEVVPGCFRNDTTFLCTIHFENIGSAPAENIYVMDTLSRYFDPSSIQIKMSTHPMFVTKYVAGGNTIMKFDFPNINLADSSDHLHRDGMLMYTIKNKPSLLGGLVLKSQAGIYFDYNDVLMTNIANVTVGCPWPLSTDDISSNNTPVTLHPNPATNELTITSPANQYERLSITNMLGERIMSLNLPKPTTTIDISTLPTGMYIVTLYGAKGSEVKKFVKE